MSPSKLKKRRNGRSEEGEVRAFLRDPEVQESIRRGREDFREGRYRTFEKYLEDYVKTSGVTKPSLNSSQEV